MFVQIEKSKVIQCLIQIYLEENITDVYRGLRVCFIKSVHRWIRASDYYIAASYLDTDSFTI